MTPLTSYKADKVGTLVFTLRLGIMPGLPKTFISLKLYCELAFLYLHQPVKLALKLTIHYIENPTSINMEG